MLSKRVKRQDKIVLSLFLASVVFLASRPLFAEFYGAGFLGGTVASKVDIKETGPGVNIKISGAKVDSSVFGGFKFGYWIDGLPYVGLESSLDFFAADVPGQVSGPFILNPTDVSVTAWGFTLMGRVPVEVSKRYPGGRFHPYIGVGPGIFFVTGKRGGEDSDVAVGLQVLAGVKAFLVPNLALFFEYKYSAFTPEFDVAGGRKDKFEYGINAIVLGLAAHF